jgi:mannose-6-phosphate isomerase
VTVIKQLLQNSMSEKTTVFAKAAGILEAAGFTIIKEDRSRPWGGFFVIDEEQAPAFTAQFFPGEEVEGLKIAGKLSPKFLIVAPQQRLSWQYHFRRAEIWRCVEGPVGVMTSLSDEETDKHILQDGDIIRLQQGERHRLMGLDNWGIVAEIWQHTNAENPSDEEDIVRLQDDFGRK